MHFVLFLDWVTIGARGSGHVSLLLIPVYSSDFDVDPFSSVHLCFYGCTHIVYIPPPMPALLLCNVRVYAMLHM